MPISLHRVVQALGGAVTPLNLAEVGLNAAVGSLTLLEGSGSETSIGRGDLVLAMGYQDGREVLQALALASQAGAAALMVKLRQPLEPPRGSCALLALGPGEDWLRVLALVQAVLGLGALEAADGEPAEPAELEGDLYHLAETAAALVGGPVVIEDQHHRVVAYSGDQATADELRLRTLLLRRMPEETLELFRRSGVLAELHRNPEPLYLPGIAPGIEPRLAVLVRSGERVLGSLWAVVRGEIGEAQRRGFARVARLATLELLRRGSRAEGGLRLESETLAHLIYGGADAGSAARRLRLAASNTRYRVAAIALSHLSAEAAAQYRAGLYQRLNRARLNPEVWVVAGELNNTCYAILQGGPLEAAEVRALLEQLALPGGDPAPVTVGVGEAVERLEAIPDSRREAERALTVARSGLYPERIAFFGAVWAHAALLRLRESPWAAELEQWSPLRLLERHDRENHSEYVATLRAWLAASGDTQQTAKALDIHANTLRYRLSRLQELSGLDLLQPEVRLVLWMQLSARGD